MDTRRLLKKSAAGVLARYSRLTISAAFTSLPRFIQRGVNLTRFEVLGNPTCGRLVRRSDNS